MVLTAASDPSPRPQTAFSTRTCSPPGRTSATRSQNPAAHPWPLLWNGLVNCDERQEERDLTRNLEPIPSGGSFAQASFAGHITTGSLALN
uniref:Uncharacterized protein n=1 Tax=Steinernema glaseri TaxID=37863 RepID=A0A1I7YYE6_9BILA